MIKGFIANLPKGMRSDLSSLMLHLDIAGSAKHCVAFPFLIEREKTRLLRMLTHPRNDTPSVITRLAKQAEVIPLSVYKKDEIASLRSR
ncbi:hypothetical protein JCM13991_12400 [Thermodesulfovibrio hydrogeniphilus]